MQKAKHHYVELLLASALLVGACAGVQATDGTPLAPTAIGTPAEAPSATAKAEPSHAGSGCPAEPIALSEARPLVDKYCVSCHSPSGAAGEDYDFTSDGAITGRRRNIEAKLRLHVMPPPNAHPQPSDAERMTLRCWAKG
ncbi:MAG: hypothetical protein ABUL62_23350 [Myxococcales bacterium]